MFSAISLVVVLVGACFLILAMHQRRQSVAAWQWPTVQAVISASEVLQTAGVGGIGGPCYAARVEYDYVVRDQTYHGSCISTGMPTNHTRVYPDSLVFRYALGSVAQVRHHPTDPGQAVLEIQPRGAGLPAAVLGLLFLGAGAIAIAVIGLRASTP